MEDSRDFGVDGGLDLTTDRLLRDDFETISSGDESSTVALMMAVVVWVDLRVERLGVETKLESASALWILGSSLKATLRLDVPI